MRTTIEDTITGRSSGVRNLGAETMRYLVQEQDAIVINSTKQNDYLEKLVDSVTDTPITNLYSRMHGRLDERIYSLLDMRRSSSIPPWLVVKWVNLDVLTLREDDPARNTLNSIREYRNKIIINATPSVTDKQLKNVELLRNDLIMSAVYRSYVNSDDSVWLSASIMRYLCKSYAFNISNRISKSYQLDSGQMMMIAAVASIYFCNKVSKATCPVAPLFYSMDFIHKTVDSKKIIEYVEATYPEFTIDAMVETIVHFGVERLKKFNTQGLFTLLTNIDVDRMMSFLVLENPAYYMFSTLNALSGSKSSLYHMIRTLNLGADMKEMVRELMICKPFMESLNERKG